MPGETTCVKVADRSFVPPQSPSSTTAAVVWHDVDSKVVFVDGALPGETVSFPLTKRRGRFDQAQVGRRLTIATPGGTALPSLWSLRWLQPAALGPRQQLLSSSALARPAANPRGVSPSSVLPALTGQPLGLQAKSATRCKACSQEGRGPGRFSRAQRPPYRAAGTLRNTPRRGRVGDRRLRDLVSGLDANNKIPQIEVAVGDPGTGRNKRGARRAPLWSRCPQSDQRGAV